MEKSTEKSVSSVASGNSINSKLRYPLRSALRSKEGKPPVPDFSGSSVPRRGRVASAVSQSTTVLDLSGKKSVDRAKPPRRLSIPTKTSSNSSVKSVSSITSVSESKPKRSANTRSLNETPVPSVLRSVTRRKVEDLSSSTYWLSHIKLAESAAKHSISLGFFKLALHAGCEPIDQMKQELKSYARRNSLEELADAMKELSELYNTSEESKQVQISETSSVVAEETAASLNNDNDDVQSSLSTPGNSNITSEIMKEDASQDSAVIETAKEEEASEAIPQGRTRRSLDVINVNQEDDVSETVQGSEDGVPIVTVVQPSDKKRASRKETVSKNNLPVRTKKSVASNSGNSRPVPENKPQKKDEKITKPRTKKIQEETKKSIKKPAAKEGEVKSLKQMKKMENKENSVVVDEGEEIQV
ncbi:unnamed protein product [Thlaspi arvense]|uniref:Uncharacterized protein n=1 Tax=Thlaspi arvense TaxID=13288 RepID=A0AAU9RJA1_THLAR|nr:unnamed protein product [Thlaspi arvense]